MMFRLEVTDLFVDWNLWKINDKVLPTKILESTSLERSDQCCPFEKDSRRSLPPKQPLVILAFMCHSRLLNDN